jgi:plasmid stabilization system protein ParE
VPRLVFTHSAQANLIEIADYIESSSGSASVAERFSDALVAKCAHLAGLPGVLGRSRSELLPDLRSAPHGNYVIFFRYVADTFEVVAILERHRDVATHFRGK